MGGTCAAMYAIGMLRPGAAFAANVNAALEAKDVAGAMSGIGAANAPASKDIVLNAPTIAENGAVVPVSVVSNLPNTTQVSILVDGNPFPLAGSFDLTNGALPEVGVRIKFSKTSTVRAVVIADGKSYTAQREVKVTAGGCGG